MGNFSRESGVPEPRDNFFRTNASANRQRAKAIENTGTYAQRTRVRSQTRWDVQHKISGDSQSISRSKRNGSRAEWLFSGDKKQKDGANKTSLEKDTASLETKANTLRRTEHSSLEPHRANREPIATTYGTDWGTRRRLGVSRVWLQLSVPRRHMA